MCAHKFGISYAIKLLSTSRQQPTAEYMQQTNRTNTHDLNMRSTKSTSRRWERSICRCWQTHTDAQRAKSVQCRRLKFMCAYLNNGAWIHIHLSTTDKIWSVTGVSGMFRWHMWQLRPPIHHRTIYFIWKMVYVERAAMHFPPVTDRLVAENGECA